MARVVKQRGYTNWEVRVGNDLVEVYAVRYKADQLAEKITEAVEEAVEKETERCVDICRQYASIEGIAQKIEEAIRSRPAGRG